MKSELKSELESELKLDLTSIACEVTSTGPVKVAPSMNIAGNQRNNVANTFTGKANIKVPIHLRRTLLVAR